MYELPSYVGRSVAGRTINEVTVNAYKEILDQAVKIPSRNGDCSSLYDFSYRLLDPRQRHLYLNGRKSNIFQLIGETIWIQAASDNVRGYLETFLPRAPEYSDDGQTWRAGYGPRLVRYNQLNDVIKFFEKDGKMTRRAVVSIHDPSRDTFTQLKEVYDQEDTLDLSCNMMLIFYVTPDDRFNCRVINRSNDCVFGMGINITEFSVIQEMIYDQVRQIHPELLLGILTVSSNNFHCYDFTRGQLESVVANSITDPDYKVLREHCPKRLGVIDINTCREEMSEFIQNVVHITHPDEISSDGLSYYRDGNQHDYVELMKYYFATKNGAQGLVLDISHYQEDLKEAIIQSPFRKFEVITGRPV